MEYQEFVENQEAKKRGLMAEAEREACYAYNKGLWNAVKFRPWLETKPTAYIRLPRPGSE